MRFQVASESQNLRGETVQISSEIDQVV